MLFKVSKPDRMSFGRTEFGNGFHITNQHGRPIATFIYPSADQAVAAATLIEEAIADAVSVTGAV
jgi:hypothetical protein